MCIHQGSPTSHVICTPYPAPSYLHAPSAPLVPGLMGVPLRGMQLAAPLSTTPSIGLPLPTKHPMSRNG